MVQAGWSGLFDSERSADGVIKSELRSGALRRRWPGRPPSETFWPLSAELKKDARVVTNLSFSDGFCSMSGGPEHSDFSADPAKVGTPGGLRLVDAGGEQAG